LYLTTNLTYTPIDLQGLDWACSFSIIEMLVEEYTPINEGLSTNYLAIAEPEGTTPAEPMTVVDPEVEALKKQYEDEMSKLETYRKKLEARKLK
jgi:hypothetical protein